MNPTNALVPSFSEADSAYRAAERNLLQYYYFTNLISPAHAPPCEPHVPAPFGPSARTLEAHPLAEDGSAPSPTIVSYLTRPVFDRLGGETKSLKGNRITRTRSKEEVGSAKLRHVDVNAFLMRLEEHNTRRLKNRQLLCEANREEYTFAPTLAPQTEQIVKRAAQSAGKQCRRQEGLHTIQDTFSPKINSRSREMQRSVDDLLRYEDACHDKKMALQLFAMHEDEQASPFTPDINARSRTITQTMFDGAPHHEELQEYFNSRSCCYRGSDGSDGRKFSFHPQINVVPQYIKDLETEKRDRTCLDKRQAYRRIEKPPFRF